MKYKERKHYTRNPELALREILIDRGVEDIENFLNPTMECELHPLLLNNLEVGANLLFKHLILKNKILFVVD